MAKYSNIRVVITDSLGNKDTYAVSKKDGEFYLPSTTKEKSEWGCYGLTVNKLFQALEMDKQEGYCRDYQIIK